MRASIALVLVALLTAACDRREEPSLSRTGSAAPIESLHRGEMAAIETYRQAIEKEGSAAGDLSALRAEHQDAADRLRERIVALGATPDASAGVWGEFAKAVEGTAKVFGNKAALAALETGERLGISDYESALKNSNVDSTTQELIRGTLLPRQRAHIDMLNRMRKDERVTDTANR
jgi:hypothetical protein